MVTVPSHVKQALAAFPDTESLTVLLASGVSRQQVVEALDVDLHAPVEEGWTEDEEITAWAILEVSNGVIAVELGGYGDPSLKSLRALSQRGGSAAVVRDNVLAHVRFGCSRNGELAFDDNEYRYLRDVEEVPAELRPHFALAWTSPDDDTTDRDIPGLFLLGLVMAEAWTGISIDPTDVEAVLHSGFFAAPNLVYGRPIDE